jgi:hypothetical protein
VDRYQTNFDLLYILQILKSNGASRNDRALPKRSCLRLDAGCIDPSLRPIRWLRSVESDLVGHSPRATHLGPGAEADIDLGVDVALHLDAALVLAGKEEVATVIVPVKASLLHGGHRRLPAPLVGVDLVGSILAEPNSCAAAVCTADVAPCDGIHVV